MGHHRQRADDRRAAGADGPFGGHRWPQAHLRRRLPIVRHRQLARRPVTDDLCIDQCPRARRYRVGDDARDGHGHPGR